MTDAELLAAHVAGDRDAFTTLIERHRNRLWAVALRVMGNPTDAADALQEALISAFRRAGSFQGRSAVTTWLHRIVVNACLDQRRRHAVRAADALPEDADRHVHLVSDDDPQLALETAERVDAVTAALRELGIDQRVAIVLVDLHGCSVNQAAEMVGCAPGTIKSRRARGRAELARLLAPLREEVLDG